MLVGQDELHVFVEDRKVFATQERHFDVSQVAQFGKIEEHKSQILVLELV
jgi:hypothetical protein